MLYRGGRLACLRLVFTTVQLFRHLLWMCFDMLWTCFGYVWDVLYVFGYVLKYVFMRDAHVWKRSLVSPVVWAHLFAHLHSKPQINRLEQRRPPPTPGTTDALWELICTP